MIDELKTKIERLETIIKMIECDIKELVLVNDLKYSYDLDDDIEVV